MKQPKVGKLQLTWGWWFESFLALVILVLILAAYLDQTITPTMLDELNQASTNLVTLTTTPQTPSVRINIEIADTKEKMLKGLAGRDHLDHSSGMMFVFDKSAIQCMWGKGMKFPVTVAYLNEQNIPIGYSDIEAGDLTPHCSPAPVKYVLEVNKGLFGNH